MLDLSSLLDEIKGVIEPLIGDHARLVIELEPGIGLVAVDRLSLEQVLVHLVANAPQAIPKGGRLIISSAQPMAPQATDSSTLNSPIDPYVVLSILYSGCELDIATQDRILFEPFTTSDFRTTNTGVRQTTVAGIINQAGGRINVRCAPHRGTTFRVYLPRVKHRSPEPGWGTPSAPRKTVLLVDDEPMVRGVAREMLRALGYVVLEAAHAQEALRICQESGHRIHLLLSDVVMPGMNGPELAERVASTSRGIKVLFMSGFTCGVITGAGEPDSSRSFLQKPFSFKDLNRKVSKALDPSPLESVRS